MKNNIINIGYPVSIDTHLLITGETGSGKSTAMHALIIEIWKKGPPAHIYLIDLKYVEFTRYKKINIPVYTDIQTASGIITKVYNIMIDRFKTAVDTGPDPEEFFPVYLFIDEYAEITAHENKKLSKYIINKINSIIRLGRAANIHAIIATQYPVKNIVSMQIKMNAEKLCLKCNNSIGYRIVLDTDKNINLYRPGQCIYLNRYGKMTQFQVIPAIDNYVNDFINTIAAYREGKQKTPPG